MGEGTTSLINTLSGNVSTIMSSITSVASGIVSSELLSLSLSFFFFGGVIGLIGRALKRR